MTNAPVLSGEYLDGYEAREEPALALNTKNILQQDLFSRNIMLS